MTTTFSHTARAADPAHARYGPLARWRPAAVMFDLDGTLIDTMGGFADLAAELINRHYGTELAIARKRYLETSGIPFRQQLEVIFPDDSRNESTAARYEGSKEAICSLARVDAETLSMLEILRSWQMRVVVSSNSAQRFVDQFQQRTPFDFDLALGFGDGLAKGEPHVELVCRHFGLRAERILFVGDSLKDAELAGRCGQRFVGRIGTFRPQDFARAVPEAPVIHSISDLRYLVFPCR